MAKVGTLTLNFGKRRANFVRRGYTMRFPDGSELKICRVQQDPRHEEFDTYICTDGQKTHFITEHERLWAEAVIDNDGGFEIYAPYRPR